MKTALSAPAGGPSAPAARRARPGKGRRMAGIGILLLVTALVTFASISVGSKSIPLGEVVDAVVAPHGEINDIVVRQLRMPRTALGLLAGAALSMAGSLIQGHTRNPLADPGLLGVSAGAAFAVVLAIYLLGIGTLTGYVWFAFGGALVASVLVFALGALSRGGPTPVTLALAGAATTALLLAWTTAVVLADSQTLDAYRFWRVGSLAGRDPSIVFSVLPFLLAGALLAAAGARGLNSLSLGEDMARALGEKIWLTRVLGLLGVTVLTGGAVAACGPIAFIGLVVPHVSRAIAGADYRWQLPYSALIGASLMLTADIVGRVVARPGELAVGIVLAFIGAPFFIALVRRKRLVRL